MSEDATNEINLGDLIDEKIAAMQDGEKDIYLRILFLLNQSDRYVKFIDDNFDIHTAIHEEAKTIDISVIEKPDVQEVAYTAGELKLDVASSLKAQMILKAAGCANTAQVLKKVYQALTGGKASKPELVTSATDADIKKELDAKKVADSVKLD